MVRSRSATINAPDSASPSVAGSLVARFSLLAIVLMSCTSGDHANARSPYAIGWFGGAPLSLPSPQPPRHADFDGANVPEKRDLGCCGAFNHEWPCEVVPVWEQDQQWGYDGVTLLQREVIEAKAVAERAQSRWRRRAAGRSTLTARSEPYNRKALHASRRKQSAKARWNCDFGGRCGREKPRLAAATSNAASDRHGQSQCLRVL